MWDIIANIFYEFKELIWGIMVVILAIFPLLLMLSARADRPDPEWRSFESPSGIVVDCYGTDTDLADYNLTRDCVTKETR